MTNAAVITVSWLPLLQAAQLLPASSAGASAQSKSSSVWTMLHPRSVSVWSLILCQSSHLQLHLLWLAVVAQTSFCQPSAGTWPTGPGNPVGPPSGADSLSVQIPAHSSRCFALLCCVLLYCALLSGVLLCCALLCCALLCYATVSDLKQPPESCCKGRSTRCLQTLTTQAATCTGPHPVITLM